MLTNAQWAALRRLASVRRGYPGLPKGSVDMRVIPALERRGLVERVEHVYRLSWECRERRLVCWRLTDAGGRALAEKAEAAVD